MPLKIVLPSHTFFKNHGQNNMYIQIILLVIGFVVLIKGADLLVSGSSSLARHFNIPEIVIGLTIVAFGTSMPEMVVNIIAATEGKSDIVFGNVIGSNVFNLFAILGLAGVVAPLVVPNNTVWKEIPFSLLAIIVLAILVNSVFSPISGLQRIDGAILLIFFSAFIYYIFRQMSAQRSTETVVQTQSRSIWLMILLIVIGLVGLVLGGRLVVNNAIEIAQAVGISEKIIGLTIIAAGTSLPELATSVVAVTKKNNDIAIGNIIGSNIFNIFLILGVSSLIQPIGYNTQFNWDLALLGVGTALLFGYMFTGKTKKLDRWEAAILLSIYIGYVIYLILQE